MACIQKCHLKHHNIAHFASATATRTTLKGSAWKKSVLATNHFQRSLPTLKVPTLENTISRYLKSQEAILNSEQLMKTNHVATKFLKLRGPQLQKMLSEYARINSHTSYITKMWFDMYLSDRRPVVLTHSPTIVFKDTERGPGYDRPSIRAANLVHGMLQFAKLLRSNTLEPEIFHLNPKKSNTPFFHQTMRFMPKSIATYAAYLFKAYPLDMSQYPSMFNGTRIPKPNKDHLFSDPSAKHIVVIHKGQMYVFDVMDEYDNTISPQKLLANLEFIANQPSLPNAPGVGSITTMPRDDVFAARQRLIFVGNEINLKLIDSAFVTLVLDDDDSTDPVNVLHNFLHGPSESRWFDKPITLIVDRRGRAAITFEHSWGDGVAVVRLCNEIFLNAETDPAVHPGDLPRALSLPASSVRRLEWMIDNRTSKEILWPARTAYDRRRDNLTFHHALATNGLCKQLCKKAGLSPDAMMQLAFQLAYNCVHNVPAATYESCSTAAFKHGRTETLRSATVETRHCVQLMRRPPGQIVSSANTGSPAANAVSEDELFRALVACSVKHNSLTREAAMGQGWDRHLFALHHFAALDRADGLPMPDIFMDDSYAHINRILLSTSTLSSPVFSMGGFAPTQHDGYGLAYSIKEDQCGVVVSSWRDAPTAKGSQFVQAFNDCTHRLAATMQRKVGNISS